MLMHVSANRKPSICITQEGNVIRVLYNVYCTYKYNSPTMCSNLTTAGVVKTNMFCLFCADTTAVSTEPYKYQYTVTFNVSALSHKKHHPNYAELFLHVLTHDHSPAQIKIVSDQIQQPITWMQPSQASGKDDNEKAAVQSVRITLTSLTNSSLWQNGSLVTITVASTNVIRMPSENHHQTALGLVLYMGGAPEAIDELLTTPLPPAAADHTLTNQKQTYSIGATHKRSTTGSTPCQLQSGFKVKFLEVKGGYERIIQPEVVDIGKCVGECPHFLHHLHNPSQHAEVRNLLAFREGSAGADITTASCVPTSFKPLPVVVYNEADKRISTKTYKEMVATSCGCR